jgi:uncharacterized protein (TIGR02271 family)
MPCGTPCAAAAFMKKTSPREETEAVIPLVQEHLEVGKREVETGRVRIRTVVDERLERVAQELQQEDVSIERVQVNREVTHPPEVREQDGVLIVPLVEEVLVVEKRLVVKEELHIRKKHSSERYEEAFRLRGMRAEVERENLKPSDSETADATVAAESRRRRPRLHRKQPPS